MAAHFSILAWEIPWAEEPGRLQSVALQESDATEHALKPSLFSLRESQLSALHVVNYSRPSICVPRNVPTAHKLPNHFMRPAHSQRTKPDII